MDRSYTRAEMETVIVWDDEGKTAEIYTASPITMRKLDKLCAECPETYVRTWTEQNDAGRVTAAKYTTPSQYIRFGKPPTEKKREQGRRVAELRRLQVKSTA